ncbi:hypothetical protein MKS88_004355 [Plasmodium brasilianum]|uniref:Uncharacterized protein n=2 Tax=Plasmodium (Plasmodium) TaxID=418103 RepID=A0A1A8X931_PLAMA|nr:conserved Plasmodium protein, unknown function [Plasmodium malariae]KAI4836557.1 hypothetical protein MKS88_004355 [Plasmodium brasilianum]SBT01752.1 hypothetical protein, conserved [Plasmodium malariae]SCO93831.1 conserved Plasmodium protein, unknown function [Plasmodium malariae]
MVRVNSLLIYSLVLILNGLSEKLKVMFTVSGNIILNDEWISNDWKSNWKNDYMLNESINNILRHAPTQNRAIINEHIKELLSGKYNAANPRKIIHTISNLVKNGMTKSLCDHNKSFIIFKLPHIIFNSDLFHDVKLDTINGLINNITKHLDGCQYNEEANNISFITNGCQSESDRNIIFDKNQQEAFSKDTSKLSPSNNFFSTLLQCSVDNIGSGEKTMICVQEHLAKRNLKMSDTCVACFRQSVDCGRSNCWMPCLFGSPCSEKCYNCATTNCNKELIRCSGLDDLPGACS